MKNLYLLLAGILLLSACNKDAEPETKIDSQALNLKYDQTHQFEVLKGNENLSGTYNWTSSDPTVGTISAGGNFKARKIGSTVIKATTNDKEFTSWITVSPYSTIFIEPEFEFGLDKATIKEKSYNSLAQESENFLVYDVWNEHVTQLIYVFEYNNLVGIAANFADSEEVQKEAKTFYKERYPNLMPVTDTKDSIYVNDGRNKAVRLTRNESLGFYASYGRVTFTNGRLSSDNKALKSVLNKIQ